MLEKSENPEVTKTHANKKANLTNMILISTKEKNLKNIMTLYIWSDSGILWFLSFSEE